MGNAANTPASATAAVPCKYITPKQSDENLKNRRRFRNSVLLSMRELSFY